MWRGRIALFLQGGSVATVRAVEVRIVGMVSNGVGGYTGCDGDRRSTRDPGAFTRGEYVDDRGSGRPAEAERRLRDTLGVLELQRCFVGEAAAATLGHLLRERSRAESILERAHVLVDVVVSEDSVAVIESQNTGGIIGRVIVHPGERED